MSLKDKIDAVKQGRIHVVDELNKYLQKAEEAKELNAFIRLLPERGLKKAAEIDQHVKEGQPTGALAGTIIIELLEWKRIGIMERWNICVIVKT
jgi:Asp-tRNA(Asn)/Glu-tRNA(Gln) amidotransferase A subunit family amidase